MQPRTSSRVRFPGILPRSGRPTRFAVMMGARVSSIAVVGAVVSAFVCGRVGSPSGARPWPASAR
eukprot:2622344-Lingulodinium_polyedra.AAC.1